MSNDLIAGARAMVDLFSDYRDLEMKVQELRRVEHVGDEMTHAILRKLNQTFITPFDREDIHKLASSGLVLGFGFMVAVFWLLRDKARDASMPGSESCNWFRRPPTAWGTGATTHRKPWASRPARCT